VSDQCPVPGANPAEVEACYPVGSAPEVRIQKISALGSFGETPLLMTGALRQLLLQHFVDPDNVMSASLRAYLEREGAWAAETPSGIYIESIARWRPELTEARPALVIKEGDWQQDRMGIGARAGFEERTGAHLYGTFWNGAHTLFALGGEGAETQILAAEVAKLLVYFSEVIADQLDLHRFQVTAIGGLAALAESTENYVVPVSVGYAAEDRWAVQLEAPRLKRVVFSAEAILDHLR
jgi:hypothetical protein